MAEMFGLLKELTASRTPKKVLSIINNEVVDKNEVEPNESDVVEPIEEVDEKEEVEDETDDETVRSVKEELTGEEVEELMEIHRSQLVGY
ncbi:hypothetical protein Tco_1248038 [Tanacetum coccineum]